MSKTQRLAPALIALAAVVTMAGCSGSDAEPEPTASETTMSAQPDAELGEALTKLVVTGQGPEDGAGLSECLVSAVRGADISPEAEKSIVDGGGEDWGATIAELEPADTKALLSPAASQEIDQCMVSSYRIDTKAKKTVVEPKGYEPSTKKPNTKPKHKLEKDARIREVDDLKPGVESMLSSFDPNTADLVKKSSACMSQVILDADFDDKTLRFLAGGAPLTTGSVAEHIKDKHDRKVWQSESFQGSLSSCTTEAGQNSGDEDGEES